MKFGMTQEQFELLQRLVIGPLKDRGAAVYLFGSRTTGKHHSHSDVDLLYMLPADQTLPSGFLSKLKESIEESRFPFAVDLVDEFSLASSYRENIRKQMVAL